MAYENYEKALINSFGQEVEDGIIKPENIDIQSNNARTKYNRYINSITNLKPREYKTSEFETLGKKYIFEKSFTIIISIFGEKSIPIALDYFQHLTTSGATEVLDGISLTVVDKRDGSEMKMVEVPDFETSSNIVTIVHEFAHYYLNKLGVDFNKKRYYEEIMSILCEKIASQIVELHTCERDFYNKITEHRLEGISWHYNSNLTAMNGLLIEHERMKRQASKDFLTRMQLTSFEEQMPFFKTAKGISALKGYYQNMADGYGIGFLYSESLLARFLDDEHSFRIQLDKLTSNEQGLQQMLDYYGINARNNSVYDTVNTRIEEIRHFKRR
jgi:hypothetical protein